MPWSAYHTIVVVLDFFIKSLPSFPKSPLPLPLHFILPNHLKYRSQPVSPLSGNQQGEWREGGTEEQERSLSVWSSLFQRVLFHCDTGQKNWAQTNTVTLVTWLNVSLAVSTTSHASDCWMYTQRGHICGLKWLSVLSATVVIWHFPGIYFSAVLSVHL